MNLSLIIAATHNELSSHLGAGYFVSSAPRWLDSLVGRALHRYHRGHGFESRSGRIFIQA